MSLSKPILGRVWLDHHFTSISDKKQTSYVHYKFLHNMEVLCSIQYLPYMVGWIRQCSETCDKVPLNGHVCLLGCQSCGKNMMQVS